MFCIPKKDGHWKLAVGARKTGNALWKNYYFLFHDNKTDGKNYLKLGALTDEKTGENRREKEHCYEKNEWWNIWFYIYD